MNELLGKRLGNYRLVQLIGRGGFAEVYQGEHVHLGTKAALKVLQTQLEEKEQEHFLQEARIIARLIHPHIVRVLDFGLEDAIPFLVMDYAPHGSLRKRYPRGTRLPHRKILPFLQQAASALDYAHSQQVIHRDVKPENMLLNQQDEIMLSDFGIATIVKSTRGTSVEEVVGTAAYMAPEQIQGRPQPASDQYALGIVLYEWLSGEAPFQGSFTEICSQHLHAAPPPLHEKQPSISREIEAVVEQALAKEPQQRFASLQTLADAFARASEDETIVLTEEDADATMRRTSSIPPTERAEPIAKTAPALPATQRAEPAQAAEPVTRTEPATLRAEPAHTEVPELPAPQPSSAKPLDLSRRSLLLAAGALLVGAAGASGLTWAIVSQEQRRAPAEKFVTPPSPTPSSTPAPSKGTTLYTYQQHSGAVYTLCWSPNGQYLVSGSADTTARVWRAEKGETLYTYQGHAGLLNAVLSVSWATNGQWIASGGDDMTAQVWEAATGNRLTLYRGHQARVLSVACAPHSSTVASGSADQSVQLWDASSGDQAGTYQGHSDIVYAVAWSPDGSLLASASADKTIQVWEAATRHPVTQYKRHNGAVYTVAWSPDGQYLASGGFDKSIQIWEPRTGKPLLSMTGTSELSTEISALAWSPDGKRIASASTDTTVRIWDAASGELLYTYSEHSSPVYTVAWMPPDGAYLASGSADQTVKIWQAM
ncbi:WD40 repeat domain-containing serine/threonine protein kinase [Ktedonosporobacter rubrisoli]|nr:serine/threonine-protein kinase [Ktedonosporobacter rubrisoli]